jgi:hypothetical protein
LTTPESARNDGFMASKSSISIYSAFFLKAIFIASAIMFGSMALGEICYDKSLFNGFLSRPILWVGVFLETTLATLFMTTIGALVLYRFRRLDRKLFALTSTAVWGLLGAIVIALYSYFYWTREWHITNLAPGLVFGWILPGLLSIICFVWLSFDLRLMT